jgi:hypothetical protein
MTGSDFYFPLLLFFPCNPFSFCEIRVLFFSGRGLIRKPDIKDVAVADGILLAFQAEFPFGARFG